jgi:radical SAM superfamily enzyme YgiQ (UPF0313 family)
MNNKDSKIILINPKSMHSWESLGLGYLASYSYKYGYCADQYRFYHGEFDDHDVIVNGCENADVIGFSLTTFQICEAMQIIRKIKGINSKATIVWGGYGVNGLSESQLIDRYGDCVDFFVQGPGEEAWIEILRGSNSNRVIRKKSLEDLDKIPYPDRELIRIDRNFEKLKKLGEGRKTSMELQRNACPYKCIFCAAPSYCKVRRKSRTAENIIGEMKELRDKYHVDKDSMVLMCDAEVFLTDEMYKMAELKRKNGIEFRYGMNVVASTILKPKQRKILAKMQESGLKEVWMGVESDQSLMHLTHKPITPDQVREAFRITREMGLVRKGYFILGFTPQETVETIKNRIPFIEEIDPDEVGFTIYIPVPGSSDYKHDLHQDIDYTNSCEYFNTYTKTDTLSNEDLQYWQKYLVDYFKSKIAYRQRENPTNSMIALKERAGRSGY